MFLGDSTSNLRAVRIAVLFSCMAAALVLVTLGGRDPVFLENGIDEDMKTAVDKIMARPTEEDNSAKTVATHEARAVKGDLMMERDLIKHMKVKASAMVS